MSHKCIYLQLEDKLSVAQDKKKFEEQKKEILAEFKLVYAAYKQGQRPEQLSWLVRLLDMVGLETSLPLIEVENALSKGASGWNISPLVIQNLTTVGLLESVTSPSKFCYIRWSNVAKKIFS